MVRHLAWPAIASKARLRSIVSNLRSRFSVLARPGLNPEERMRRGPRLGRCRAGQAVSQMAAGFPVCPPCVDDRTLALPTTSWYAIPRLWIDRRSPRPCPAPERGKGRTFSTNSFPPCPIQAREWRGGGVKWFHPYALRRPARTGPRREIVGTPLRTSASWPLRRA